MPESYTDLEQGNQYQTLEEGKGPVDGVQKKDRGQKATKYDSIIENFESPDKKTAYPSALAPVVALVALVAFTSCCDQLKTWFKSQNVCTELKDGKVQQIDCPEEKP